MVLLNTFQAALYRQLSNTVKPLDEVLSELVDHYRDNPTIFSDLLYLLSSISVSNAEAEEYFKKLESHRTDMELALGHRVDLRVALMDYFVHVQPRYESPKIIELRDYQQNLSEAMADSLTGLPNRRSIEQLINNELARSTRYGHNFSIIFLDIDHFKEVNDSQGHQAGDDILKSFAQFLKAQTRGEDMAGRFGGEEFVILLPQTSQDGVDRMARRLLKAMHELHFAGSESLTFSAGVSEYPRDGKTSTDLMARADERMYQAKHEGRNRICTTHGMIFVEEALPQAI